MNPDYSAAHFIVWGCDLVPYGPVELPTLISWVQDERVTGDTWVYLGKDQNWQKAAQIPELQLFFRSEARVLPDMLSAKRQGVDTKPGALRRIKILATLSDEQIQRFMGFMEIEPAPQWKVVVKQGEHGDTMYLILDGELRVRTLAGGKETIPDHALHRRFFRRHLPVRPGPPLRGCGRQHGRHAAQDFLRRIRPPGRGSARRCHPVPGGDRQDPLRAHPRRQPALRKFRQDASEDLAPGAARLRLGGLGSVGRSLQGGHNPQSASVSLLEAFRACW